MTQLSHRNRFFPKKAAALLALFGLSACYQPAEYAGYRYGYDGPPPSASAPYHHNASYESGYYGPDFVDHPDDPKESIAVAVRPGDTVHSIAREYGADPDDIIAANGLRRPYSIYAGQELVIPAGAYYRVKSGDTLYRIAKRHGVSARELADLNNISVHATISPGDKLRVPPSVYNKSYARKKTPAKHYARSSGYHRNGPPPGLAPYPQLKPGRHYGYGDRTYSGGYKPANSGGNSNGILDAVRKMIDRDPADLHPHHHSSSGSGYKPHVSSKPAYHPPHNTHTYDTPAGYTPKHSLTPPIRRKDPYTGEIIGDAGGASPAKPAIIPVAVSKPAVPAFGAPVQYAANNTAPTNTAPPSPPEKAPVSERISAAVTAPLAYIKREAAGEPPPRRYVSSKPEPPAEARPAVVTAKSDGDFLLPVNGRVISAYGPRAGGLFNEGVNISAPQGTPVRAAGNGKVVYAGNALRGYGNLVLIQHDSGYITTYAHNDRNIVEKGDTVRKGQTVAYVGNSGQVTKPQLHFSIRKGRESVDPGRFFRDL